MSKSNDPKRLGRSFLLGIAAGTIPLAGIGVVGTPAPVEAQEQVSDEAALFGRAVSSSDPAVVSEYLRKYPNGRIRELLRSQPASVLSRLDPGALVGADKNQLRMLSDRVVNRMPAIAREQVTGTRGSGSGSNQNEPDDPYGR